MAGYTIAMRVVMFALLPAVGLGNAAATLVGQNLGARNPARAERGRLEGRPLQPDLLGRSGVALIAARAAGAPVLQHDSGVIAEGSRCLRIVALGFGFYAYAIVVSQAFNGAGDTRTPTLINLGCFWLGEIPLAVAARARAGAWPAGAYAAITTAFSVAAVVSVALFRRGRWKTVRL